MVTTRGKKRSPTPRPIQFMGEYFLKIFFVLLLILAALWISSHYKRSIYFPINEVEIVGATHTDHAALQQLVQPMVVSGFFAVNVNEIKERLTQFPWVDRVIVQRIWPHAVVIRVVEKNPIAHWNRTTLISAEGELFQPPLSSMPEDLPTFLGPEGKQIEMLDAYNKLNNLVLPLHFKIATLEWAADLSWTITFDNGIKIALGQKDILAHFSEFVQLYPKIIGDRIDEVEYIDSRYPNGIAVKWKENNQAVE